MASIDDLLRHMESGDELRQQVTPAHFLREGALRGHVEDLTTAMRVLLVEDNENDMRLARHELEQAGHTVIEARRPERGLALAYEHAPQVILCDLGFPGDTDGYAFAQRVKSDPSLRNIPTFALTGARGGIAHSRATQVFDGVLEKPLDARVLAQRVGGYRVNGGGSRGRRQVDQPPTPTHFDPADTQEFEASTPIGKFRARGYDLITALLVVGVAVMSALFYRHVEQSQEAQEKIIKVIEQNAVSTSAYARALDRMTCIISLEQNKRESAYDNPYSRCNRQLMP